MSEPISIISLSDNKRKIFEEGIENHEKTNPRPIPYKEKWRKKNKNPVCQLSSAGLSEESLEVFHTLTVQLLLLKAQTSEDPGSIGEMLFPFFNLKNFLINISLALPSPIPVKPIIRVEMLRRDSHHDGHHTDVNDEPGDEIEYNRPESGKIDEPHASNLFPLLS